MPKRCTFQSSTKPPTHNSFSDYFVDCYLQQPNAQKDLLALPLPKQNMISQHHPSNPRRTSVVSETLNQSFRRRILIRLNSEVQGSGDLWTCSRDKGAVESIELISIQIKNKKTDLKNKYE